MDLSVLPNTVNEYSGQGTEIRFTVRSASSPNYNLSRRFGVRKPLVTSEGERKDAVEVSRQGRDSEDEQDPLCVQTGSNGANQENQEVVGYRLHSGYGRKFDVRQETNIERYGSRDQTGVEPSRDQSVTSHTSSELRGRTGWRTHVLPKRSKSLDCQGRQSIRDKTTAANTSKLVGEQREESPKPSEGLDEKGPRARVESAESRLLASEKDDNAATTDLCGERRPEWSQRLSRVSRGHSFPSRLRTESQTRPGEAATPINFKGSQSILNRIEKLYGSAGIGQTDDCQYKGLKADIRVTSPDRKKLIEGGTFPRRLSSRDISPSQHSKSMFPWTPLTDNKFVFSPSTLSPVTPDLFRSRERVLGEKPWQSQPQCDRGLVDRGTRSLDRLDSKYTMAHIRAARDIEGSGTLQPRTHTLSEDIVRGRRASGDKGSVSQVDKMAKDGTNAKQEERSASSALRLKWIKEDLEKGKRDTERGSISDDVFESNTNPRVASKTTERKNFAETALLSPAANVRNKISQFEALTQRGQNSAAPRRTFSMPAQVSNKYEGVKKSASVKAIGSLRDRWEGCKDGGQAWTKTVLGMSDTAEEGKKDGKSLTVRAASVSEAGQRLWDSDIVRKDDEKPVAADKRDEDPGACSRLRETPEPEQEPSAETGRRNVATFCPDDTDFVKATSLRDAPDNAALSPSSSSSCSTPILLEPLGGAEEQRSEAPSVSDDDHTPTNTPGGSPGVFHSFKTENPSGSCSIKNSTPVSAHGEDNLSRDRPSFYLPLATLPDLDSPEHRPHLNGDPPISNAGGHLDAWVASLSPRVEGWSDDDDDDDDDGTEKDEDSEYDSDESSVTITSNMSQDRRSFCVSLADLCNFAGVDYESENDSDDWGSSCRRSASLSSDVSALSYVSVLPTEELDRLLDDVKGLGDNSLQGYEDVQVVVLHKEMGVGLGFSLAGGVDQNKPITVHRVFHTGVAAQQGSIQEGDQVLSINGTALQGFAHGEALRILRRAKTREMGVVVLRRVQSSSFSRRGTWMDQAVTESVFPETGQRICVCLEKNARDLGFSLEGGTDSSLGNKPLKVQKIFQGGPVEKVLPGDELLEIEGVNVMGMRRLEAWTLIRKLAPGPVEVVLRRPSPPGDT